MIRVYSEKEPLEEIIFEETKLYNEGVPFFSKDSTKLYVHSDRPDPKWDKKDYNIWYYEKRGDEWKGPNYTLIRGLSIRGEEPVRTPLRPGRDAGGHRPWPGGSERHRPRKRPDA